MTDTLRLRLPDRMMLCENSWALAAPTAETDRLEAVFQARGWSSMASFMTASWLDPFSFREMTRAVSVIARVIATKGSVVVFGDYDADGLTATAIMVRLFRALDVPVRAIIPDRFDEGYGLSAVHVEALANEPPALFVSVDCGSNSVHEIKTLKALGVSVVVTDHHVVDVASTGADATLNPRCETEGFALLAGAGVAYALAEALANTLKHTAAQALLPLFATLATVGTIADVVPLIGANRALVQHGLHVWADHAPQGLLALTAGEGHPTAETIAFQVAPRLNAASRMGCLDQSLELLLTDRRDEAVHHATTLTALNETRKTIERETLQAALAMTDRSDPSDRVVVAYGEGWHRGVVGIVASRLVARYGKPAVVLSLDAEHAAGSARSVPGFDLHALFTAVASHTERFGGHHRAAGIVVPRAGLMAFCQALQQAARAMPPAPRVLEGEMALRASDQSADETARRERLRPFGEGHREIQVYALGAKIVSHTPLASGAHVRYRLKHDGVVWTALHFGGGAKGALFADGERVDLLATLVVNTFRGVCAVELRIIDIRPADATDATDSPFDESVFAAVYRVAAVESATSPLLASPRCFASWLRRVYNKPYTTDEVRAAFEILSEAGVLHTIAVDDINWALTLTSQPTRPSLRHTDSWRRYARKGRLSW